MQHTLTGIGFRNVSDLGLKTSNPRTDTAKGRPRIGGHSFSGWY
jgi:hypothetical protein